MKFLSIVFLLCAFTCYGQDFQCENLKIGIYSDEKKLNTFENQLISKKDQLLMAQDLYEILNNEYSQITSEDEEVKLIKLGISSAFSTWVSYTMFQQAKSLRNARIPVDLKHIKTFNGLGYIAATLAILGFTYLSYQTLEIQISKRDLNEAVLNLDHLAEDVFKMEIQLGFKKSQLNKSKELFNQTCYELF